jgi:hypothetical protein
MNHHLWIRSPACEYTLEQACDRYNNFLKLFQFYPNQILVPTLDIDIAWHTHQLSAINYRKATEKICGRFIDHDDKLGQGTLDTGWDTTKKLYKERFGKEYDKCLCWDDQTLESLLAKQAMSNSDMADISKQTADDVSYYRAVEVARRSRKPLPLRN